MLKLYKCEEKNLNNTFEELNCSEEDVIIFEEEITSGLFKTVKKEFSIVKNKDLIEFIKKYFSDLGHYMGLDIIPEIIIRDNIIKINLATSNNSVMIGKNGRTIKAIRLLLNQVLSKYIPFNLIINIDVANYLEKQNNYFIREVEEIAREVLESKANISLEPMNSYERRIVHNVINKYDELESESSGIGLDRYITIKYKN